MRDLFLSGKTALEFLLSPAVKAFDVGFERWLQAKGSSSNFMAYLEGAIPFGAGVSVANARPKILRAEAQTLAERFGLHLPLCVNVVGDGSRRNSQKLHCLLHPASAPDDRYFRICEGLSCATPALALIQAADCYSDVELIVLASTMFGVFARDRESGRLVPRRKLCEASDVLELLDRCGESGARMPSGAKRLRRLLDFAVTNAASPKEIESALRLGLPARFGGCGFGLPSMNFRIARETGEGRPLVRYCDMCWPASNVVVEYDSNEHHASVDALEADALHSNDLTSMGARLFRFTAGQLADQGLFEKTASQLGEALFPRAPMGRLRALPKETSDSRYRLARQLRCALSA